MNRRIPGASLAAAVALAATAVTGVALAGNTPDPARAQPIARTGAERTLTLITGDRVTVDDTGRLVSAQAGPGRTGVTFASGTDRGHLRVVPSDAGGLLAAGRLDSRLFDVTELLSDGFDRRDQLPLLLAGGGRAAAAGVAGLVRDRDLPAAGAVAVRQPHGTATASWRGLAGSLRGGLRKIWLDGVRHPVLDVSVPQVGAPAAWAAGYNGTGTTVAVLDTGVDDTHPDLAGQVVGRQNFTDGAEPDADLTGHGTHVAATIASTGAASGGKYRGVAPGAKLLDGKVCVVEGCAESWILAGMAWAAEQHAKVVNLSLGGGDDPGVVDPLEEAVQTLSTQYGTLFVIAAGNTDGGVVEGAVESPGTAPAALTVGAVDDHDSLADFSRRGPGPQGALKPEITAPGVDITAARGKDATAVPGKAGDPYTTLSGTSMATPHVAGAAAILAQQHAGWTGQRLKTALMSAAEPNPAYGVYAQGAGRLDVGRAVRQAVTSTTAGLSLGVQLWPHTDDEVRTGQVAYHNDGTTDVTLALRLDAAGSFTVSPAALVVPAGGDASATVTADTRMSGPDGDLGGWLTASAGDLVVRTPVAVVKEVESYDVTLVHLDRSGATPYSFWTTLFRRDSDVFQADGFGPDPDNKMTLRLPAGHYTLVSTIFTNSGPVAGGKPDPAQITTTELAQPDLAVTKPMTVDLDARLGQPLSVTVPRPSATQVFAGIAVYTRRPHGTAGRFVGGGTFAGTFTAALGPDEPTDGFLSYVAGQWAQGDGTDSPYLYSLLYPVRGRMVTGYRRSVADRELARVRLDIAATVPGSSGLRRVNTALTDFDTGFFGPFLPIRLPSVRTEFVNADAGVESGGSVIEAASGDASTIAESDGHRAYRAGQTYEQSWNRGVFAPHLATPAGMWDGVTRTGDRITVGVGRFGDGDGRPGDSTAQVRTTALYRDGVQVADAEGTVGVPADDGTYRLELTTERGAPFDLSTKTRAVWTFGSGHADAFTPLPLWDVRFTPDLDRYNAVPAGRTGRVPVAVTAQPGSSPGTLGRVTVEVSFDDGATWRATPLRNGAVQVTTPTGKGFVSLRTKAADSAGNSVEQTVVHAYRFG